MDLLHRIAVTIALFAAPLPAWAVTHTFTFRDTLLPREGGPALVPVYNGGPTATVLTEGQPGFVGGSFVTQTLTANACPSTPTVRGWRFPARGGLRHPNMAPVIATGSYTISMLVRFTTVPGGYLRLIDFSNSTLDTGIYVLGNGVSFYPVGTYAMGSFTSNRDTFVTLTRDAATRVVNLYINGMPAGTYTDTMNLYAPTSGALYFFLDNTTGPAAITESGEGTVAYIQVADTPLSPAQVTASLNEICMTVRCGDGVLNPGEGCDSGMAMGSSTCDAMCRIRNGNPCNTMAPGATGNASCASGMCLTMGLPAPGRCGECITSNQCSGATPICNAANTCVACGTPGAPACPEGTVCATSGTLAGRCVQCMTDAQCSGTTPRCDPTAGRCVACSAPGAPPCPGGTFCASDGACVACLEASHCSEATPACHPTLRRCVPCYEVERNPCAAGRVCERSSGRCVPIPDASPDVGLDVGPDVGPDASPDVLHTDAAPEATLPDAVMDSAMVMDDGEPLNPTPSGGCGCRVKAPDASPKAVVPATLAVLLALVRRRRRCPPETPFRVGTHRADGWPGQPEPE